MPVCAITERSAVASSELPKVAVAEHLAQAIETVDPAHFPEGLRRKCEDLLVDVVGLCVTARNEDYVQAQIAGWDDEGPCTAIGHARSMPEKRVRAKGVAPALTNR